MKTMKYICVCLLIVQVFMTPVLSCAEKVSQSTENKVTEDSKTNPLPDSEGISDQLGELAEEETIDSSLESEISSENATNQSEDSKIDGNLKQESSDKNDNDLKQQEVRETRGVISSMWGTSPVTFDEETGVLTIEAGVLESKAESNTLDKDDKIKKNLVKEIILKDGVKAPVNSEYLFSSSRYTEYDRFSNLNIIFGNLNTSDVNEMGGMFYQASSLTNIDVSSWVQADTDYNFTSMFEGASSLTSIDLSTWKCYPKRVWNVVSMFKDAKSLVSVKFNSSNKIYAPLMDYMFMGAESLTSLDISNFELKWRGPSTSAVSMLLGTINLKTIIVQDDNGEEGNILTYADLPDIDTSTKEYTGRWERTDPISPKLFYDSSEAFMNGEKDESGYYRGPLPGTYKWEEVPLTWGTAPVSFEPSTGILTVGAGTITNYRGNKFDDNGKIPVSSVNEIIFQAGVVFPADSSQLFQNCTSLEKVSGPVDTTNVTDMSSLFYGTGLTTVDVSSWDVSKVTNMSGMFGYSKIRELDVSNWDTRNVTDMEIWTRQTGLKEIKLGENFRFAQGNYGEYIPIDQPETDSEFDRDIYSGGWERIDPIEPRSVYKDSYEFYESYDGSLPGTYTWQEIQLSLEVKDSILYVGDKWATNDNLVSATDKFGDPLEVTDLQVEGSVKTDTAGVYEVTYKNDNLSETAKVTVKENKKSLKVKDTTLYVGDNWASKD
ncbi:TPA: BspA family leucine-rich repeat surface protein, partial [Listeria monocytogenes]|nr:BspA family leucine-rich repeat surface protein [Listeria monocytogenes]HBI6388932.1 BspA family leucine-rich repeat surface protein [Listeria monocytogenes]HBI6654162.1 BspA family leucine-rich repeat surface protein [Listeria monocytogenes]